MSSLPVELLFGRGTIKLSLPDKAQAHVISKPDFPPAESADKVYASAMANGRHLYPSYTGET